MKRLGKLSLSPASEFSGSVMTLLSGAAVALAISYLIQPVLTRLYTPADFGLLDTFIALLALAIPFASGKYEDAVVLPETDEEAGYVLGLSVLLLVGCTALFAVLLVFREAVATFLGIPDLKDWLLLFPPALLLVRLSILGELWNTRRKKFKSISGINLSRSVGMNATKLAASSAGVAGLFAGYVAGFTLSAVLYGKSLLDGLRHAVRGESRRGIGRVARRYADFPRYTMPAGILGAMVSRLPFLLLLYFFSAEVVGLYGRAFAAIMVPLSVIGASISSVFYVYAAERRGTSLLTDSTERVADRLILFGMFPTVVVVVAGPTLFEIVFGAPWSTSGTYARLAAPWLFLSAVASPLTRLFDVLERQALELQISVVLFVLQTTALVAGGLSGDPVTALICLAAAGGVGRIIQLTSLYRIAGVRIRARLTPYAKYAVRSVPGAILLLAALQFSAAIVAAAVLSGTAIYGLLSWREIRSAFESGTPDPEDLQN